MKKDKENTTQKRYAKKTYLLAIYMLTNGDKKLKRYILILGCFLSLSTYAATEESKQKFTAKIPDGTTIELVGLRYFDKRYLKTGIFHVGGLMALLYLILLISINELDERITTLRKN